MPHNSFLHFHDQETTRIEYVKPIGTLYGYNQKVIDCNFTFVNATHLESGQTSAFEMTFSGRELHERNIYETTSRR